MVSTDGLYAGSGAIALGYLAAIVLYRWWGFAWFDAIADGMLIGMLLFLGLFLGLGFWLLWRSAALLLGEIRHHRRFGRVSRLDPD